jgi:hypothetical protein
MAADVDDDALPFLVDLSHRLRQLCSAVASDAAQHVSGEALRVHTNQHAFLAPGIALDQSDVRPAVV